MPYLQTPFPEITSEFIEFLCIGSHFSEMHDASNDVHSINHQRIQNLHTKNNSKNIKVKLFRLCWWQESRHVMVSQRTRGAIITSLLWRRFDVIMTLLLRHVPTGIIGLVLIQHQLGIYFINVSDFSIHRNSNSMETWLCYYPNSNKMIVTKLCTWHDSETGPWIWWYTVIMAVSYPR